MTPAEAGDTETTMEPDEILLECEERMDGTTEYLGRELRGIRTGRANTALLEYLKVDYYGSPTDLRELAAVSVAEATVLMVKPFDPGAKNEIIKAIESADLGLNPQADGNTVRISIPSPTSQRRQQLIAQVKKLGEESKVAVRNERRDANKSLDQAQTDLKLGDDEIKGSKSDVDDLTKSHTAKIDEMIGSKVTEIEDI
ncbi:MAG: ribosome recycling factor [Phycisphaerales bacterium]|nr:ribosome recycling factor [Phycisphaerales bacterium]